MKELLKNPFVALAILIGGLLALRLVLSLAVSVFWLAILGVVIYFIINERFRRTVMIFIRKLFLKD